MVGEGDGQVSAGGEAPHKCDASGFSCKADLTKP